VFEILPITFVIDYAEQHVFNVMIQRFQMYFNTIDKNKALGTAAINTALAAHPNLKSKSAISKHNFALKESMNAGYNLWVLKPNDLNRGRGVHIFNSLEELRKLIVDYTTGVEVMPSKP